MGGAGAHHLARPAKQAQMKVQSACRRATHLLAVALLVGLLVACASSATAPEPQPVASDRAAEACMRATGARNLLLVDVPAAGNGARKPVGRVGIEVGPFRNRRDPFTLAVDADAACACGPRGKPGIDGGHPRSCSRRCCSEWVFRSVARLCCRLDRGTHAADGQGTRCRHHGGCCATTMTCVGMARPNKMYRGEAK